MRLPLLAVAYKAPIHPDYLPGLLATASQAHRRRANQLADLAALTPYLPAQQLYLNPYLPTQQPYLNPVPNQGANLKPCPACMQDQPVACRGTHTRAHVQPHTQTRTAVHHTRAPARMHARHTCARMPALWQAVGRCPPLQPHCYNTTLFRYE